MLKPRRDRVTWLDRGWQPVWFGFCPSEKAWKHALKRLKAEPMSYPDTDGRMTSFDVDGKVCCLVTMRDGAERERTLDEIVGILAHEGTHIWQEIRSAMGETSPSSEFEAYSVQAITQGLFDVWHKTRGHRMSKSKRKGRGGGTC